MAGRGPAPKDPAKRARTNSDPVAVRKIQVEPAKQPPLPQFSVVNELSGRSVKFVWPAITRSWWKMWKDSPLSAEFTASDWSFLLDTAVLHARYWQGDLKVAGELRLRVAKFGATPEDRLRLRIDTEPPKPEEPEAPDLQSGSRGRRGGLKVVPDLEASGQ